MQQRLSACKNVLISGNIVSMISEVRDDYSARAKSINNQIKTAAEELHYPIEERVNFSEIVDNLNKSYEKDEAKRQYLIHKTQELNKRYLCFNTTEWVLKGISAFLAFVSLIQFGTSIFVPISNDDDHDSASEILSIVFLGLLFLLFCMYGTAFIPHIIAQRAWKRKNDYKELTWEEKKNLKKIIDFFKDVAGLNFEDDDEAFELKIKDLANCIDALPKKYKDNNEDITIYKNPSELLSYLLLSYPPDHPVRKKLKAFEKFIDEGIGKEEDESLSSSDSETTSSELSDLEIHTFPRQKTLSYEDFVKKTFSNIEKGITMEGGLLSIRQGCPDSLSDRQKKFLQTKFKLCSDYIELEEMLGHNLDCIFLRPELKIKKKDIFSEVGYQTFKPLQKNSSSSQGSFDASNTRSLDSYDIEAQASIPPGQKEKRKRIFNWLKWT